MGETNVTIGTRPAPAPRTFEEAEVALAASLEGYESRPQQQALARAIEKTLAEQQRHLIAEAGCGTGKSLGYLIPAILSGRRVVVSTATKALQDQLAEKDLPFLAEHLGVPFTFAVLKGRSNYLCMDSATDADPADVPEIADVLAAAEAEGFDGLRDSLGVEVANSSWSKLTVSSEECTGSDCPFFKECFATKAKNAAKEASVVVVNHALLLTDTMLKMVSAGNATMIGAYDVLIVDEAHELEEYATNVFGQEFTEGQVRKLVTEVRNFAQHWGDTAAVDAGTEVVKAMARLWETLEVGRIRPATIAAAEDEYVDFANALHDLNNAVWAIDLGNVPSDRHAKARQRKERLGQRAGTLANRFTDVCVAEHDQLVRWVVRSTWGRRNETRTTIKSAPIDVSDILAENLFGGITAVLVSATIAVNGSMDFIAKRLGVGEYDELDVGSPFDFESQSMLYVPEAMTPPDNRDNNKARWAIEAVEEIASLVRASDGRALLLFTSSKAMRDAYEALATSGRLDYQCMMQGDAPNRELAARFMEDPHSVLFATRSFFTGVDFQGDACSLVVIDKLPFPVPTEPMVEARCDRIKAAGGNDFREYTVPIMTLVLKQGFGRLIRHRGDRGVVAILDSRLVSKPYGRTIMDSLPPATRSRTLAPVEDFYDALAAA